jgi:hypothetical protein
MKFEMSHSPVLITPHSPEICVFVEALMEVVLPLLEVYLLHGLQWVSC